MPRSLAEIPRPPRHLSAGRGARGVVRALIKGRVSAGYLGGARVSAEMTPGAKQWARSCCRPRDPVKRDFLARRTLPHLACPPNNNRQQEKVSNPARQIKAE